MREAITALLEDPQDWILARSILGTTDADAISWRAGSKRSSSMIAASATTSRVRRPLPMITASAARAKPSGCWRSIRTPFIEVTVAVGDVISAFQPGRRSRLNIAAATKESISLNPSNVSTAIRMPGA